MSTSTVTALLAEPATDQRELMGRLMPAVYGELRRMAHRHLAREGGQHSFDTTGLVHEAYLKLVDSSVPVRNRRYFFGAAARAMRQVLVDAARRRQALKRGGGQHPLPLEEGQIEVDAYATELIHLDDALGRLASDYPRAARVVECRFFGGLGVEETGEVLDVSPTTVKRDWALAKAWLKRELAGSAGS